MIAMEIGGVRFRLDPAAISALRYRAEYGNSIVNDLARCVSAAEAEGRLLRMCHMMIPVADRPELLEFARLARKDPDFLDKARVAKAALLAPDPQMGLPSAEEGTGEAFDEYRVLALLACIGVDLCLIYDLPILHLVAVAHRAAELRDPESKWYRPMTDDELLSLYPRRR
ncbi:hypothetical protein AAEU42_00065 [Pseudoflavonifractor phocaeensis]|uniref:hypothetical protein n=1 Tax=Pseudoflavonifractor phocaeensis TaxID=1870988 RepID=UPI00313F1875